jgi:hypothetical protein
MGPPISMNDHISPAHPSTSTIYISLAHMGPPIHIGNNCTPSPSVIIKDIHNMGPWSAGPSDTGYYVGQVACMIQNLSLKGLNWELRIVGLVAEDRMIGDLVKDIIKYFWINTKFLAKQMRAVFFVVN